MTISSAKEALLNALDEIAAERRRQIEVEGWSPEHDDEHLPRPGRRERRGPLAEAAECYIAGSTGVFDLNWPWDTEYWKPTTYRRDLIKAAALIVAEIERLDRAALRAQSEAGQP
jgi:hypothetical protein